MGGLTITDEGVKEKPKRKLLAGGGGGPGGGDEHLQEGPTSVRTLAENEAASYPQCYIPFMSAEHGRQSCIEQMQDVSAEMQKSVAKSRYLDCLANNFKPHRVRKGLAAALGEVHQAGREG